VLKQFTCGVEGGGCVVLPIELHEGRESLQRVEEAGTEQPERAPLVAGAALGHDSEQPHEERDERAGERQDDAAQRIHPGDCDEDHERDDRGREGLGQKSTVERVELLDAVHGCGHDLAGVTPVVSARPSQHHIPGEFKPEIRLGARRRALRRPFSCRCSHGPQRDAGEQCDYQGASLTAK
jgi:hypothetical protein